MEMLLMNRLVIVALFLAAMVLACGKKEEPPSVKKPVTGKQVQEETKEAIEALKAYTEQQKEEYPKRLLTMWPRSERKWRK
jgi:hypothetical protein